MPLHILALDYGPDLINEVANQYIKAINSGFGLIRGDVTHLLNVLILLSIVWSGAMWALSDDQVIIQLARKVIYIGFFAWIIQNWPALTDKLARSFMNLGLKAGNFDGADSYTGQPGNIAYLGYTTGQPLLDQIRRLTGPVAFFKNFPEIAFLFIAFCAIMASFCVITVQVVLALLTFKFGSLAAFVLVPFAVLTKTAFIAERPLGWVVGSGIRLMVLTLVLGVGNNLFQALKIAPGSTVTTYQAFCIALAAVLLMVLSMVASRLAADLIIGGPSLGVGTAVNTLAMVSGAAQNAAMSRPSLLAVRAASAVPGKGTSLVTSASLAVIRKLGGGSGGGRAEGGSATVSAPAKGPPAPKTPSSTLFPTPPQPASSPPAVPASKASPASPALTPPPKPASGGSRGAASSGGSSTGGGLTP